MTYHTSDVKHIIIIIDILKCTYSAQKSKHDLLLVAKINVI